MLGKMMKYEIKATQRTFLPIYGLIIIFALLIRSFTQFNFQHMSGAFSFLMGIVILIYVILIAAAFIMTIVATAKRFTTNLLGDEGYLSFTLPVKIHSHIDCKMLVSLMWAVLSVIVTLLSVFVLSVNTDFINKNNPLFAGLKADYSRYDNMAYLISFEIIVLVLISMLCCILQIYASATVGNLCGKHRRLASFGTFIGLGIAQMIVYSFIINYIKIKNFSLPMGEQAMLSAMAANIGIAMAVTAAFCVAFYFLTYWLLSRKLNLE
jgi:hypothetical protein